MKACLPSTEGARLKALRGYRVLDTPPDRACDDLVRLAAQLCQVPIALISLVDEHRQWFKAKLGLPRTETSRDEAFCAHAILEPGKLMQVPDTLSDPRFATNPLVLTAPHVRFYAGMPLVSPEGHAVGTLCVLDQVPRQLNSGQID